MPQSQRLITDEEFDNLSKIIQDDRAVGNLSTAQRIEIGELFQAYTANKQSERNDLIQRGFTDKDIRTIEKAQEGVPKTAGGQGIAPRGGGGLTSLQIRGLKQGVQDFGLGILDLAEDIGVSMKLISEEDRVQWKAALDKRNLDNAVKNMEEFGQLPGMSESVGEFAPWLASLPASAANFTMLVVKRMLQGGFIGAAGVQPKEDTLIDRAFGTGVGAAIGVASTAFSVKDMLKQRAAKSFIKAFNDTDQKQRELVQQMVQEMTNNPEFAFSMSQVSGGRFAFGLELGAANKLTKAAQNRNIYILTRNILKLSRSMSSQGMSAGQVARALRGTLEDARSQIYKAATDKFDAGTSAIVAEFGDDVVVGGQRYLAKLDGLIAEQSNLLLSVGSTPSKGLVQYRALVDLHVNPVQVRIRLKTIGEGKNARQVEEVFLFDRKNKTELLFSGNKNQAARKAREINEAFGGLDAEQSLQLLAGLNKLKGGKTIIFDNATPDANRTVGRALMGAFAAELESKGADPAAKAAITALRGQYKDAMAVAQAIDETVVAAAFGGRKLPKSPGKRLDAVLKNEKEDLVEVRNFLEAWNPDLLQDLRRVHLRRIVTGGVPGQPDVDSAIGLKLLAKRLADGMGREGQAGKGLHTAATQAQLVRTAKALRIINNKYFTGITPGGIKVEEVAINVISRAPEFMARFIARALSSGQGVEAALLSPSFRQALITLAEKGPGGQVGKAAMIFLSEWIAEGADAERAQVQADNLAEAEDKSVKPEGDF